MRAKKQKKVDVQYIPLEAIKDIDDAFLNEMESVRKRLTGVRDPAIIEVFQEVLLSAYKSAIELKRRECAVDYDIKLAEISERRRNLKPYRRCWLWRLVFQPLTNRAQDIIEERAKLDADIMHTSFEAEIEIERKKLLDGGNAEKLSKRELNQKLKQVIKEADAVETNEAFAEPSESESEQEHAGGVAEQERPEPADEHEEKPAQVTTAFANVEHRPRAPRGCRKQ